MARTYVPDGQAVYRVLITTVYEAYDPERHVQLYAHCPEPHTLTYSYGPYGSEGAAKGQRTRRNPSRPLRGREVSRSVEVQVAANIDWRTL